jgi:serine/threonine protein kinase/Tol biopolymer transport system component
MSIQIGTRLGPYEIVSPLGAGGMGEVWRAKDTRLDRDVAIKVLPLGFATNDLFRQRFEREARAISQVNHPNICTLYDIGQMENVAASNVLSVTGTSTLHYIVMELLEGESLSDRLKKGPLLAHEVLRFGREIAAALDAAHRRGIVHRDLKPGNVMLTKAGAKLVDFGLARTATDVKTQVNVTHLPTSAEPLTQEGMILGTFQYMAPEQLEGLEADPRTDIFALGTVLYEMATGKRAFEGNSKTSLIAAIVTSQPEPISSVAPLTPPALDHIVQKCLEKDPDFRWQSAHDVASELQWMSEAGSKAGIAVPLMIRRKTRERLLWILTSIFAILSVLFGIGYFLRAPKTPAAVRASFNPPPHTALIPFDELGLALSPEGNRLAFVANGADGGKQIWIRDLSSMSATPVPETNGAWYPFWSPDGQHLGFFANGKLWRVDLRGGSPKALADAPSGRGGSWGKNDLILFTTTVRSPIFSVPASGGPAVAVTKYDPNKEITHRWPIFLPDNKHFLYISRTAIGRLMIGDLKTHESKQLIEDATNVLYVKPGYLIYGRSANLYAQKFDASKLALSGDPVPIVDEKLSYWEPKNYVAYAASDKGTIVYLPDFNPKTVLRWYDRSGRPLETIGDAGYIWTPRLSHNGKKIAFIRSESPTSKRDLWIYDVDSGRANRASFNGEALNTPEWSPDGTQIAFLCQPNTVFTQNICIKQLEGGGEIRVLYKSPNWAGSANWSPDGKRIVFDEQSPQTGSDLWTIDVNGGKPQSLLQTSFEENGARYSPDGRWLVYTSNETGRNEIYVRPANGSQQQWQISNDGGVSPRWRTDGSEIFFTNLTGDLMSSSVKTDPSFQSSQPKIVFHLPETPMRDIPIFEDVSAEGQRVLLDIPIETRSSVDFHLILNWTSLLQKNQ